MRTAAAKQLSVNSCDDDYSEATIEPDGLVVDSKNVDMLPVDEVSHRKKDSLVRMESNRKRDSAASNASNKHDSTHSKRSAVYIDKDVRIGELQPADVRHLTDASKDKDTESVLSSDTVIDRSNLQDTSNDRSNTENNRSTSEDNSTSTRHMHRSSDTDTSREESTSSEGGGRMVDIFTRQYSSAESTVDYGLESEPFIVWLESNELVELLCLTEQYILEKDINGELVNVIDRSVVAEATRETRPATQYDQDRLGISVGADAHMVRLKTRAVKKQDRDKLYTMENEQQTELFLRLIARSVYENSNNRPPQIEMQCLTCSQKVQVPQLISACPSCASPYIYISQEDKKTSSVVDTKTVNATTTAAKPDTVDTQTTSMSSLYQIQPPDDEEIHTPVGSSTSAHLLDASDLLDSSMLAGDTRRTGRSSGATRSRQDSTGSDIAVISDRTYSQASITCRSISEEGQLSSSPLPSSAISSMVDSVYENTGVRATSDTGEDDRTGSDGDGSVEHSAADGGAVERRAGAVVRNSTLRRSGGVRRKHKNHPYRPRSGDSVSGVDDDGSTSSIVITTPDDDDDDNGDDDDIQSLERSITSLSSKLSVSPSPRKAMFTIGSYTQTDRDTEEDSTPSNLHSTYLNTKRLSTISQGSEISMPLSKRLSIAAANTFQGGPGGTGGQAEGSGGEVIQYNHDNPADVDHRLKLYLSLNVLKGEDEEIDLLLRCDYVRYSTQKQYSGILLASTKQIYFLIVNGREIARDIESWLSTRFHYSVSDLQYIDIGLDYQAFRLEFTSADSSECIHVLVRDKQRCQAFIQVFTTLITGASMSGETRLENICRNNPDTASNLQEQVMKDLVSSDCETSTDMSMYCLVYLNSDVLDDLGNPTQTPESLLVTSTHLLLVSEDYRWPVTKVKLKKSKVKALQMHKGQQFTTKDVLKIQDITGVGLYRTNPTLIEIRFENEMTADHGAWVITMTTERARSALLTAISQSWEAVYHVELAVEYHEID